jgi:serine phosphatase RsbU (regulator of sigma subunit)
MKIRNFISSLFIQLSVLCVSGLSAQNDAILSLQNFVNSIHSDTARIEMLIELSQKYSDSMPDKAFDFGFKALVLSKHLDYLPGIGKSHNNLGDLYWYENDYVSSSEHYSIALGIYEELNDKAAIADCYRNIGWINYIEEKYSNALSSHAIALAVNKEIGRKKELGKNYNDIGIVYASLNKYNEALNSYCESLEIQEAEDNKKEMSAVYGNISDLYNSIGNLGQAIENSGKSIKLAEEIGYKRYLVDSYFGIGKYYLLADSIDKVLPSLEKGFNYATEIRDKNLIKDGYCIYAQFYAKLENFNKALEYTNLAIELSDSIYNETNSRQLIEMTAKYDSEKKMRAINDLEKDKKIAEEQLLRENRLKIYLLTFCLMVVIFAFILYRSNVQKQKVNAALSKASLEIEEKNKSITDSINYSKHIQDVSLPSKELKYKLFKNAFIYFAPKDIVSGDFYWYTEKNGKKLIACCDCTGHGVPGALMSMIGNNILNKIVNEKGIVAPDEILNVLHKEIRSTLKQNEESTSSRDGMDIAIIALNSDSASDNTQIEYAGAHRPLWIVSASSGLAEEGGPAHTNPSNNNVSSPLRKQGEPVLTEIKPDKLSIGGVQNENERKFTKHTIMLSKGDCIYIFSDGYIDQFGGERSKRFTSKRFKEVLMNNFGKPMPEQEITLHETLNEWKGSQEQIDDILIIGIKI